MSMFLRVLLSWSHTETEEVPHARRPGNTASATLPDILVYRPSSASLWLLFAQKKQESSLILRISLRKYKKDYTRQLCGLFVTPHVHSYANPGAQTQVMSSIARTGQYTPVLRTFIVLA